jgi:hypothetical protein
MKIQYWAIGNGVCSGECNGLRSHVAQVNLRDTPVMRLCTRPIAAFQALRGDLRASSPPDR